MCSLFGSPVSPGRWWFSSATYSNEYRKIVKDAEENVKLNLARQDMATVAQASVNPMTKRAEEGHLFNLEAVRTSEIWEGSIEYMAPSTGSLDSALSEEELLGWLGASLLFTRRIGGRRRRGWGRCRFYLKDNDGNEIADAVRCLLGGNVQCAEDSTK